MAVVLASALASAGCANHLRFVDVLEEDTETQLRASRVEIEGAEEPLRSARATLTLVRIDSFEDSTARRTVRYDEHTPFSGWRELYEVPGGLVSVPLSFGVNALSVALLGYLPHETARRYTWWTWAALNPLLNAESETRTRRERVEVLADRTERSERAHRTPLARRPASVRFDGEREARRRSDARGVLSFHLLEAIDPAGDGRPLRLIVSFWPEEGEDPVTLESLVHRDLASRLRLARGAMRAIDQHRHSPHFLARAVFELDRLGFDEYSLSLEDEIAMQLHGAPAVLGAFTAELDRLYGTARDALPAVSHEATR